MSKFALVLKGLLLAAAVILISEGRVSAQLATNVPPPRSISLDECVALALENNLDIRIERFNPSISRLDLDTARAGYDPTFNFSTQRRYSVSGGGLDANKLPIPSSASTDDSFTSALTGNGPMGFSYTLSGRVAESYGTRPPGPFDTSSGNVGISMTQPLLRGFWFDDVRYNIAISRNQLKVSELRFRQQVMTVVARVEQAYYDLVFSLESVKVQEQALQLARQLADENRRRVSIGTLPRLSEKQSEAEVAARQTDVTTAKQSLDTAQNLLKRLITSNYLDLHPVYLAPSDILTAVPFTPDLQESWSRGLAQRPDLLQSRLDVERQGITVKYLKHQKLPQLDVTGGYGYGASGDIREYSDAFADLRERDKPQWNVGAVLSIPVGNRVARNRYRQSKMTAEQLVLSLRQLEENVLVEIDQSAAQVRSSLERVRSTREASTYAEAAVQAEQVRLQQGSSTSYQVFQLQRDLTAARTGEIGALTDYNKALSALALSEGATLERRRINLEVK